MSALSLGRLLAHLGPEVEDPDEETFILFAYERPTAQNLGFIDSHASVLDLTVAGRDLVLYQSPAILTSNRSGGTTGAVLWKISPVVAEWLARPSNFLFSHAGPDTEAPPLLGPDSAILELGCGIAGIIGLVLTGKGTRSSAAQGSQKPAVANTKKRNSRATTRRTGVSAPVSHPPSPSPSLPLSLPAASFSNANTVGRYVLTDQPYVAKYLIKNLEENGAGEDGVHADVRHGKKKPASTDGSVLYFRPLDWETDQVTSSLLRTELELDLDLDLHRGASPGGGTAPSSAQTRSVRASFDAVLACDCIYNEALVTPLVQTFADTCRLREKDRESQRERSSLREPQEQLPPTVCVVAQQLRDPDVLAAWLAAFHAEFRVWRIPEELLDPALCPGAGFAVHIGILRTTDDSIV